MYSPLEGSRGDSAHQCGMNINCCVANGSRGYMMIPRFAVMTSPGEVYINLYSDFSAQFNLSDNNEVTLKQKTSYPEGDKISLSVFPKNPKNFTIALRIPDWSRQNSIFVNGEEVKGIASEGYAKIAREWKEDDKIELQLDLRGRLVKLNGHAAILREPIALARDSRFNDGFVDEAAVIQNKNSFVDLKVSDTKPRGVWLSFTAPLKLGTGIASTSEEPSQIHFCDFGSAGNSWDSNTCYRVWLPESLNIMNDKIESY